MGSFGENLRRERELRGIPLLDIAEATKISLRFLEALESDRMDVLPGGIFRRSFVREYARHLGLDPDRTVSEFLHAHGDEAGGGAGASGGGRTSLYRRLFFGGMVVLAAGACAW